MRTILRGTLPALLLLALLLAPLPSGAQAAGEAPRLEAYRSSEGELHVVLTAPAPLSAQLVVTHDDPLLGTVVDRVVAVDVDGATQTTYELPGVRAGAELLVRLVPAGAGPGLLRYADLYDGASAVHLEELARAVVPQASDAARTLQLPTHDARLLDHDGGFADFRQLVTREGILVVGYEHGPTGSLAVRASRDGGHTWGREHVLRQDAGRAYSWAMGELSSGKVRVFSHDQSLSGAVPSEPWSVHDLDPLADRVSAQADVANTITFGYANDQAGSIAVLEDGTALLPEHVSGSSDANVTLWRLVPGGTTQAVAVVPTVEPPAARLLAAEGDRVALVYTTSSAAGRVYVARSEDAGASWSAPAEVSAISRLATGWGLHLQSARMGSGGAVHMLVSRYEDPGTSYYYARLTGSGTSTARVIDSNGSPTLAVDGARVGVTSWAAGEQRYMESTDAGSTFITGPKLATRFGHSIAGAFLPDGRLTLLGRSLTAPTHYGVGIALPFDPRPATPARILSSDAIVEPAPVPPTPSPTRATPPPTPTPTEDAHAARIAGMRLPYAESNESIEILLANDGAISIRSELEVRVNGAPVLSHSLFAQPGEQTVHASVHGLRAGDEVEAELQPGGSIARGTVQAPLVMRVPEEWATAPTPRQPSEEPSAGGAIFYPEEGPSRVVDRNESGSAPEPLNTEAFSFWAEPADVLLPRGGRATVTIAFRNDDPNYDMGSEPPLVLNLPEGVSWSMAEREWRVVRPGERVPYEITLYAAEDAPITAETVSVQGRRGMDRPAFQTQFTLRIEEPQKSAAMPPVGYLVAAALAGLVGAGVAFRDWLRWLSALALAPMYTRISKAQVLGNDVRKGIYDHVVAHPGARLAEIAKALSLSVTPTLFHLRVLEREGYVASRREWSRMCYYPTERAPAFPREPGDVASTLTRLLVENPGMPPADVAQRLGISRQLARYHLLALERQGVLRRAPDAKGYTVVVRQ